MTKEFCKDIEKCSKPKFQLRFYELVLTNTWQKICSSATEDRVQASVPSSQQDKPHFKNSHLHIRSFLKTIPTKQDICEKVKWVSEGFTKENIDLLPQASSGKRFLILHFQYWTPTLNYQRTNYSASSESNSVILPSFSLGHFTK